MSRAELSHNDPNVDAVSKQDIEKALVELAAFLAAAARGNVDEAIGYGPLRLLQGVHRVNHSMSQLGVSVFGLGELAEEIEQRSVKIQRSPDAARDLADRMLVRLTDRLIQLAQVGESASRVDRDSEVQG